MTFFNEFNIQGVPRVRSKLWANIPVATFWNAMKTEEWSKQHWRRELDLATVRTEDNTKPIRNLSTMNSRAELVEEFGLFVDSVHPTLKNDLDLSELNPRWVPRLLLDLYNGQHLKMARSFKKLYSKQVLQSITTVDDTWSMNITKNLNLSLGFQPAVRHHLRSRRCVLYTLLVIARYGHHRWGTCRRKHLNWLALSGRGKIQHQSSEWELPGQEGHQVILPKLKEQAARRRLRWCSAGSPQSQSWRTWERRTCPPRLRSESDVRPIASKLREFSLSNSCLPLRQISQK